MIRFERIEFLYLIVSIVFFYLIYYLYRRWRRKKLLLIGQSNLVNSLIENYSGSKPFLKFNLIMIAYVLLLIALANPQIGTKLEEVKRKGVEVIIALDISNSMLSEDIKPNRLAKAKQEISKLIDNLSTDKIGIIVFAGKSFVQLPLTTDYSAAKLMLSTISTDLISTQGTAIGSAIETAIQSFSKDNTRSKVLILISDGENHEDDALEAARKATENNIVIYTIGMGTLEGAPIPIYQNGRISSFLKGNDGQIVITKLVPEVMQRIAAVGNGDFYTAQNMDLTAIIEKISKMEQIEFGTKQFTNFESRFQYFLAGTILLLLLELLITEQKIKPFAFFSRFFGAER